MAVVTDGRVADIAFRTVQSGGVDTVEVVHAPPLSAISLDLLAELGPDRFAPGTARTVLLLPGGIRYRVGQYQPRTRTFLLCRLP